MANPTRFPFRPSISRSRLACPRAFVQSPRYFPVEPVASSETGLPSRADS
jgi:hypothetical protein